MAEINQENIAGSRMRVDVLLSSDPSGANMQSAADCVADMRHWCDGKGFDFDAVIADADVAYHSDYGQKPVPPVRRLLNIIENHRQGLVKMGIPADLLEEFERRVIDGVNAYIATEARPVRGQPDQNFEQSVRDVSRDSWSASLNNDLNRGMVPEQVYESARNKLQHGGVHGPAREGAVQAIKRFCTQNGVIFDPALETPPKVGGSALMSRLRPMQRPSTAMR